MEELFITSIEFLIEQCREKIRTNRNFRRILRLKRDEYNDPEILRNIEMLNDDISKITTDVITLEILHKTIHVALTKENPSNLPVKEWNETLDGIRRNHRI